MSSSLNISEHVSDKDTGSTFADKCTQSDHEDCEVLCKSRMVLLWRWDIHRLLVYWHSNQVIVKSLPCCGI